MKRMLVLISWLMILGVGVMVLPEKLWSELKWEEKLILEKPEYYLMSIVDTDSRSIIFTTFPGYEKPEFVVNDKGWVSFVGEIHKETTTGYTGRIEVSFGIYLWDGKSTRLISKGRAPSLRARHLDMNNNGQLVWLEPSGITYKVCFYNGESIRILDEKGREPTINNNGWVVWVGWNQRKRPSADKYKYEYDAYECIYLWDGKTIQTITEEKIDDLHIGHSRVFYWLRINDRGCVVWTKETSEASEASLRLIRDIYLWDGKRVRKLVENGVIPEINDNNWVVWNGWNGRSVSEEVTAPREGIFLWDGKSVRKLASGRCGGRLKINNNGWVAWNEISNERSEDKEHRRICLWDGKSVRKFSKFEDAGCWIPDFEICDNGWLIWRPYFGKLHLSKDGIVYHLDEDGEKFIKVGEWD